MFKERRNIFLEHIKAENSKPSILLLISDFENIREPFQQESSFYYLTGIEDPASVLLVHLNDKLDGQEILFQPNYGDIRKDWVKTEKTELSDNNKISSDIFERVEPLGEKLKNYYFDLFSKKENYQNLIKYLEELVKKGYKILTLNIDRPLANVEQRLVIEHLSLFIDDFKNSVTDVTKTVNKMRRIKSHKEIEQIYKAIEITISAHYAVANLIKPNKTECEIAGIAEYIFRENYSQPSFTSIVAAGRNSTIIHHKPTDKTLNKGNLAIVDIGARRQNYCADLTRTYPVSGSFNKKQKELYQMVLNAQEIVAKSAQPGYWLNNPKEPKKSLNHIAIDFFKKHGYEKHFKHGIGHFLGLDVHDPGNYEDPLKEGDIITIEPGIYIPEKSTGIRIEDNYWIIKGEAMCLSENLPRDIERVEKMVNPQTPIDSK